VHDSIALLRKIAGCLFCGMVLLSCTGGLLFEHVTVQDQPLRKCCGLPAPPAEAGKL
jgi:hypothetical protein